MKMKTTKRGKKIIEADDKGMAFAQPLLMKHRILVADDDSSIRDIFKIILHVLLSIVFIYKIEAGILVQQR